MKEGLIEATVDEDNREVKTILQMENARGDRTRVIPNYHGTYVKLMLVLITNLEELGLSLFVT